MRRTLFKATKKKIVQLSKCGQGVVVIIILIIVVSISDLEPVRRGIPIPLVRRCSLHETFVIVTGCRSCGCWLISFIEQNKQHFHKLTTTMLDQQIKISLKWRSELSFCVSVFFFSSFFWFASKKKIAEKIHKH